MADHDGHTVTVGPVTVGETVTKADPIDIDAIRKKAQALVDRQFPSWAVEVKAVNALALCDEVDRLRDLLAKALPHIDPNDSDDAHLLTVAIRDALDADR